MSTPKLAVGDRAIWRGKVVIIRSVRFDYPMSAFTKYGNEVKPGYVEEWLYQTLGSGREIREKNLTRGINQNAGTVERAMRDPGWREPGWEKLR